MKIWIAIAATACLSALCVAQDGETNAVSENNMLEKQKSEYDQVYADLGFLTAEDKILEPVDQKVTDQSLRQLEQLHVDGYADASNLLGVIHLGRTHIDVPNDIELSERYFRASLSNANSATTRSVACGNLAGLLADYEPVGSKGWFEIRELSLCGSESTAGALMRKPLALSYLFAPDNTERIAEAEPLLRDWLGDNPGDEYIAYLLAKGLDQGWYGETRGDEACQFYHQAAELDEARAFWPTGMCYLRGSPLGQDESEAFGWVMRAAEEDIPDGLISAAVMHAIGQGTKTDPKKAAGLYERAIIAAEPGSQKQGHAMRGLAGMHVTGEVPDGDQLFGYALMSLANDFGDDQAPIFLEQWGKLSEENSLLVEAEKKRIRLVYKIN